MSLPLSSFVFLSVLVRETRKTSDDPIEILRMIYLPTFARFDLGMVDEN